MAHWILPTEDAAQRVIDAIDAELGPTEELRLPDGATVTRPRKTWAVPIELRDGRYAVPHKPRLGAIEGRSRDVRGIATRIPTGAEAVTVADGDRTPPRVTAPTGRPAA